MKTFFFFSPADEGGVPADVQAAGEHIEEAETAVEEAVKDAPKDEHKELLLKIHEELGGLREEMRLSREERTAAAAAKEVEQVPDEAAGAVPDVVVETPKPAERYIRRNGKKVKRSGK